MAGVAKKQEGYVKRMDFGCVNPAGSATNPSSATQTPIPAMLPSGSDCVVAQRRRGRFPGRARPAALAADRPARHQPDRRLHPRRPHQRRAASCSTALFNGAAASPNFNGATRTVGAGIPAPVDIDPFTPNLVGGGVNPNNIPIDSRFLCGPYCNYASYFLAGRRHAARRDRRRADQVRGLGRLGPDRLRPDRRHAAGLDHRLPRVRDRSSATTTTSPRWRTASASAT